MPTESAASGPNPRRDRSVWAVVPAGGAGTRLWPLSRAARPKFLLPLLGDRSLLQQTVDRVATAVAAAREGWLTMIGLAPTRPETGYGYIERSEQIVANSAAGAAYRAERFVEKPDPETAAAYVASGRFLWNASMFAWQARALLEELARLQPELLAGVTRVAKVWGTPDQDRVAAEVWADLPESTIDQGVLEQANRIAVVPATFGWSDVGDWNNLGELIERDDAGNSVRGDLVQSQTRNSVVWSETGRLVALVGLENIAVVDTEDALLVVDRNDAQEVRRIVEQLKTMRRPGY